MLAFSEIRHLEGIKGNFEVSDEKEYVAIATLNKAQPIPQLIFSNVPEIVEQQQFVFDSFWNKGIPAEQRIREIEEGVIPSVTTILKDYKEAEKKEFDLIRKAIDEIQIIYSTASAFHLQAEEGVLELLKEKAEKEKNLHISILLPLDPSIRESLSHRLLTQTINNNIQIQSIASSIDIKIKSLAIDRKEAIIIELKHLQKDDSTASIGFSIYSNSIPTVLSYVSIFEVIHNQSVLSEELKQQGDAKDEFINTAAHELRTPTQAITGYSEMNDELFDNYLSNRKNVTVEELTRIMEKLYEHHENISRNASRLNILTNNLLDVARFESNSNGSILLQKEKIDLVKEIDDLIEYEFSQKLAEKDIKINFINDSLGENYWLHADRMRLNQILINLVDNAIKFSKEDDSIDIIIKENDSFGFNLGKRELDHINNTTDSDNSSNNPDDLIQEGIKNEEKEKKVKRMEKGGEDMVYVGISDTGKGISSKIMPKLFQKFTTDSDFGTGLGLFITRKLVEAHGGRIWAFNNNDGIGSTFVFSLPK